MPVGAGERLEGGLGEVVIVTTGADDVQRQSPTGGKRLEEMRYQRGRQRADRGARKRQVDHRVGAAAAIERRHGPCLIERNGRVAESRKFTERLRQRLTQHQGDILHRVVGVDLEVARRLDVEIEASVHSQRAQQVVEEGQAGRDLAPAAAVERQPDRDFGLLRLSLPDRGPGGRHGINFSIGITRIEVAPTAFSGPSSAQTASASTTAWTAIMLGSASGMMVGDCMPGITPLIRCSASAGAFIITYFLRRAAMTLASIVCRCYRRRTFSSLRLGWLIRWASETRMVAMARSPLTASVLPVDTRSTIASATPSRGVISTAPLISISSTATLRSLKNRAVVRGCEVATGRPSRSSMRPNGRSSGTATCSEQ